MRDEWQWGGESWTWINDDEVDIDEDGDEDTVTGDEDTVTGDEDTVACDEDIVADDELFSPPTLSRALRTASMPATSEVKTHTPKFERFFFLIAD